jgi:hypothetical protein
MLIKSRRIILAGNVAYMGKMKNAYKILVRKSDRDHLEDLDKWEDNISMVLREIGWNLWIGFIWLRVGTKW